MFKIKTKVCGFYKIETFKKTKSGKEYGRRVVADWFPNLITDAGMNAIATTFRYLWQCVVGSDSTTPTVADIALGSQVAMTGSIISEINKINNTSPYYKRHVKVWRFGEGAAAGNLSEVGIKTAYGNHLFSRALILDGYGSPTTITVLSDEYLDVTYEFRYYPLETDVTGTVAFTGNIGGTYDYTMRVGQIKTLVRQGGSTPDYYPASFNSKKAQYYSAEFRIDAFDGGIGTIFTMPSGNSGRLSYTQMTNDSYVAGSFILYCNLNSSPTDWNFASGIKSVAFHWGMSLYQCEFNPAIPKTATDVLKLKFSHEWARL